MNVEELIIETFKKAVKMENRNVEMGNNNETKPDENIRIIYPCYSDKTKRFSEQEIKQLFIQTLIENQKLNKDPENDFYFSVETPTEYKYVFKNEPKVVKSKEVIPDENPVSARFDLCLYRYQQNEFTREYLIEFKAKNKAKNQGVEEEKAKEIKKDFLKLFAEGKDQNHQYFIHVIDSYDKETEKSINEKYTVSMKYCEEYFEKQKEDTYQQKDIIIYLLILNNKYVSGLHYFRIHGHGTKWKIININDNLFEDYEPLKDQNISDSDS